MAQKKKPWKLYHTMVIICLNSEQIYGYVLFSISLELSRIIFDEIVIPLIIERKASQENQKWLGLGYAVQIILGNLDDFFIGICLLYLCYNNGKHALKKKQRKEKKKSKGRSATENSSSEPQTKYMSYDTPGERPNYGTESINSILLASSRHASGNSSNS